MVTEKLTVINEQGLHMRPAGVVAKAVKAYTGCEATLEANGKKVKASSPMQIMSACIKKGTEVIVSCDGEGEEALLKELTELFESGFGE